MRALRVLCAALLAGGFAAAGDPAGARQGDADPYALPVLPEVFTPDGRFRVDLELVLAVDVSSSIDEAEARRQRLGHVEALADPAIIEAIQYGGHGRIAVIYIEWAEADFQRVVAPWTVISSEGDALALATVLAEAPFVAGERTAIGTAIARGVDEIERNAFDAPRRIIDISGDGELNSGIPLREAHARARSARVVVNGLPVSSPRPDPFGPRSLLAGPLERYFEDHVITGAGAFISPSRSHEDFVDALRRKLILEIAGLDPALHPDRS